MGLVYHGSGDGIKAPLSIIRDLIVPDPDFWLSDVLLAHLQPLLPNQVLGVPRVEDRKVIRDLCHVIHCGRKEREAPT